MTNNGLVRYETDRGEIALSPKIIRQYLVNGNGNVTDQEVMMFLNLCRYQRLNPFLREAHLIKFGNSPATMVVGKETFTKRAAANDKVAGWEAGVIVLRGEALEERTGTLVLPGEELVGGWARVHRKDWKVPMEVTVSLNEYERRKANGELMAIWANMPATMIRKVALVQALREAMPQEFQGMYSPEEMPIDASLLDETPIGVETVNTPKIEGGIESKQEPVLAVASQPTADQAKKMLELVKILGLSSRQMSEIIKKEFNKERYTNLSKSEADKLNTLLESMLEEPTDEELEQISLGAVAAQ